MLQSIWPLHHHVHFTAKRQFCRHFSSNIKFDTSTFLKTATPPGSSTARTCPLHYRYGSHALASSEDVELEEGTVLFSVGGLYGNLHAFEAVKKRVSKEVASRTHVVFNGDFNFFNSDEDWFLEINESIRDYQGLEASIGNVELEISDPADEGGCGCAYPDYVDDGTVERSNEIVSRLREVVESPGKSKRERIFAIRNWMKALPLFRTYTLGGSRIGIVHGDAESLAGWGFALENIEPLDPEVVESITRRSILEHSQTGLVTRAESMKNMFLNANVDSFLSTHTCLPVCQEVPISKDQVGILMNNGSAGMPNTRNASNGLMTRVAEASIGIPEDSVAGAEVNGLRYDLIPVLYNNLEWERDFLRMWPKGSAAYDSYFNRISKGVPSITLDQVNRLTHEFTIE